LVERCLGRRGGRLREIGCGAGGMLAAAAEAGYVVTGVEPSEDACARARKRLGNNGRVICGDISSLTETSYYDVCVLADVIEHVKDPRDFLARVHGLLREGGVVIIATPSLQCPPGTSYLRASRIHSWFAPRRPHLEGPPV
jgi:2-polyprenyl-3-methyl-5-hydroxy-6-metoxy-1,4-benzoquinol methylase